MQFAHGHTHQFLGGLSKLAVLFQLACSHAGVTIYLAVVAKPFLLAFAGMDDAFANGSGSFLSAFTGDVAIVDSRHFNVQIDAIKQRTRDALTVALYLDWAAAAFALEIAEVTARAGIHRRHQHELAWKCDAARRARHSDFPILQRLAHHLQCGSFKLR